MRCETQRTGRAQGSERGLTDAAVHPAEGDVPGAGATAETVAGPPKPVNINC